MTEHQNLYLFLKTYSALTGQQSKHSSQAAQTSMTSDLRKSVHVPTAEDAIETESSSDEQSAVGVLKANELINLNCSDSIDSES